MTSCAHQARPLTRRDVERLRASYRSKAVSMPRRTASRGMPASRHVSMRAQSRVERKRMEPRRRFGNGHSISVK